MRAPIDKARRALEERVDQAWAITRHRLRPPRIVDPYDGDARFAILTVNFSTTRWLQLMLLTLADQDALERVRRIVIVDNGSRDGGAAFARELASRAPRISVVENTLLLSHARGMRTGLRHLDAIDSDANVVLFVDCDVIFRDVRTLARLAGAFGGERVAAAGELRRGVHPVPEAQASFLAVRRDVLARPDIAPWVNHGSPAYWLQRSIWRAGLEIADFPSNAGGYVLHRGRSGVGAARRYRPLDSYASVVARPHYMGVPGGERIWTEMEAHHAEILADPARVLDRLAQRFA